MRPLYGGGPGRGRKRPGATDQRRFTRCNGACRRSPQPAFSAHVSTDYVFDGSGTTPWRTDDPTGPLGAYGRTKLHGEHQIAEAGGHYAILRTSWVFSAHGKNFAKTILRLAETRDKLTIVADQIGGPTPAADIAETLLKMAKAGLEAKGGGVSLFRCTRCQLGRFRP